MNDNAANFLKIIAEALDRLAPDTLKAANFDLADAFIWDPSGEAFSPVKSVNHVPLKLLKGIDTLRDQLMANTMRFARSLPANNALLWGARGMGKSSLIKSIHAEISSRPACTENDQPERGPIPRLKLIEIHREDISSLPSCLAHLRESSHRFIVFCDDLSFEQDDTSYKSLKAVLEGGLEGRPANVLFYATSNRRHLIPRERAENETSLGLNLSETLDEKISLSDRFGLWIGFHKCNQDDYLEMVCAYADYYDLAYDRGRVRKEALEWAITRGARSGRVAWQYIQDLSGRLEKKPDIS